MFQLKPASYETHNPPETPPANILLLLSLSIKIARVLPPALSGPTSLQSNDV